MKRAVLPLLSLTFLGVVGLGADGQSARKLPRFSDETTGLYRRLCSSCHGSDGHGVAKKAARSPIPDLTSASWQKGRTDAQILASLLNGLGDDMPAFDDRLSKDQAQEMVALVRAFGPEPAKGASGKSGSFETEFRRLEQEFEALAQKVRALEAKR